MPRPTLLVTLVAMLWSSQLAAQVAARPDEIQPGAKVRVTAPGVVAARYAGTVLARSGDTLTIGSPNAMPLAIPTSRITTLEVSRGKSRADGAVRGMKWGTPIGLAFGVLTMGIADECLGCATDGHNADGRAAWVGMNVLSGVLWGAGIGALIGRERWETFDIPRRTAIGLAPGRATLALRYEF
jgi:hypothetical protein